MGFYNIAQEIEKHYGFSKGIQNHMHELTLKIKPREEVMTIIDKNTILTLGAT